jgi:hypothetical protein
VVVDVPLTTTGGVLQTPGPQCRREAGLHVLVKPWLLFLQAMRCLWWAAVVGFRTDGKVSITEVLCGCVAKVAVHRLTSGSTTVCSGTASWVSLFSNSIFSARSGHAMVVIPSTSLVLLLGGNIQGTPANDAYTSSNTGGAYLLRSFSSLVLPLTEGFPQEHLF